MPCVSACILALASHWQASLRASPWLTTNLVLLPAVHGCSPFAPHVPQVWAFFETRPDVSVSRLFTDAHDQLPAAPDLLGFSFAWELDYVNIMSVLEQLGIPLRAEDRDDSHPLVGAGCERRRDVGWVGRCPARLAVACWALSL